MYMHRRRINSFTCPGRALPCSLDLVQLLHCKPLKLHVSLLLHVFFTPKFLFFHLVEHSQTGYWSLKSGHLQLLLLATR